MNRLVKRCSILALSILTVFSFVMPGAYAETVGPLSTNESIVESQSLVTKTPERKNAARAYKVINNNKPSFKKSQMTKKSFERYGKLDSLGRCTTAFANVSKSTMPKTARGSIGMIKPTGWHTVRYSECAWWISI